MSERDTNTRRVVLVGGAALAGASLLASPARAEGPR
jgi:hypothetical protein